MTVNAQIDTSSRRITRAGTNIFEELGFVGEEAANLQAESQRIIAEKLAIKRQLMEEIAGWMVEQELKQAEAAAILHVSRPRVSDVVRKETKNFTIDSLVDMLSRTGKKVQLALS